MADRMGGPGQDRVALLKAAREQIQERGIPDEPRVKAAVTAVREAALDIISKALQLPVSADPLGSAWTAVAKRARDSMENNL